MFIFSNEKNRLYEELDTLRGRVAALEDKVKYIQDMSWEQEVNHPYGIKKDGAPKAKPGRKPKK